MLRFGPWIEQAVAHECDELIDLLRREGDRCRQDRINARQHWVNRTSRTAEIGGELLTGRGVAERGSDHVEVMTHSILKASECPIMHECWLHGDITEWRCTKLVAVLWVARDLFSAKVFICARPIKCIVRHVRRYLRDADDMILKIAEHLIRLACNAVAHTTARRTEEQQRTLLFIIRQRIPLAARKPIDWRIGEGSVNSNSAIAFPNIAKVIGAPSLTSGKMLPKSFR